MIGTNSGTFGCNHAAILINRTRHEASVVSAGNRWLKPTGATMRSTQIYWESDGKRPANGSRAKARSRRQHPAPQKAATVPRNRQPSGRICTWELFPARSPVDSRRMRADKGANRKPAMVATPAQAPATPRCTALTSSKGPTVLPSSVLLALARTILVFGKRSVCAVSGILVLTPMPWDGF